MSQRRDELAYHLVCRGNRRRLRPLLRKHPELRTSPDAMLIYAALWHHRAMLRWLLEHDVPADSGVNVDDGNTPLMHAASEGDVRAMKLLLAFGANPNAVNTNSENPLGYAATYEHPEAVKVLIAAGVDVNDTADSGPTVKTAA
jgi:ankyrin repeat protein